MKLKTLAAALWLGAAALLASAPAFAQSAALVTAPTTTDHCASWGTGNGIKDSGVRCSGGNVQVDDAAGGSALLTPNIFGMNVAGILNNSSAKPFIFTRSVPATAADAGDFSCRRTASYTGGTPGFVNPCMYVYTVANPGGKAFEWAFLSRLDNYGTVGDAAENVSAYFQARKMSSGPTWGAVTELYDMAADPAAGSVTDEHDMTSTGSDVHNARVLFDGWVRNAPGSFLTEAAYGIRLNTDTGSLWKNGLFLNGHFTTGINMVAATIDSAGIILGDTHALCFDSSCLRKQFHQSGVTYLSTPSGNTFSWSDAGQFSANSINAGTTLYLNAGGNLCLTSSSCSTWLTYDSTSGELRLGNLVNGNVFKVNGGGDITGRNVTVAGITGTSLSAGSGAITGGAISGSTITGSSTIQGPTLQMSSGNGMTMSGSSMVLNVGGTTRLSLSTAGVVGAQVGGAFAVGFTTGVSCSGAPTASFASVGGIVTHC